MSETMETNLSEQGLMDKKIIQLFRVTKDNKFQRCYCELVSLREHEMVLKKGNGRLLSIYSNYNILEMIRGSSLLGFVMKGEIHPLPLKMINNSYSSSMTLENYKKYRLQQDEEYKTSREKLQNFKDEAVRMVEDLREIFDPQNMLDFESLIQKLSVPLPVYTIENDFTTNESREMVYNPLKSNSNTENRTKDPSQYKQDPRYFRR
jgi:hypothetical protein